MLWLLLLLLLLLLLELLGELEGIRMWRHVGYLPLHLAKRICGGEMLLWWDDTHVDVLLVGSNDLLLLLLQ